MPSIEHQPKLTADARKIQILEETIRLDQARLTTTSKVERQWLGLKRSFSRYYFARPPLWRVLLRQAMPQERATPDFASIGAVRSGTSQLSDYIMQHPCVVLPLAKEMGVTRSTESFLLAQFPTRGEMERTRARYGKAITGYCTPVVPMLSFAYFAKAIAPQGKIILIMRNPVERTFAHWRWFRALLKPFAADPLLKYLPDSFDEVVRLEIDALRTGGVPMLVGAGSGAGMVHDSIYAPFVKQLLDVYRPSVLYLDSDDFFANSVAVAKRVYDFLELPPYDPVELPVRNASPTGDMDPSTRKLLSDFFAPYNQELFRLIGRDWGWS